MRTKPGLFLCFGIALLLAATPASAQLTISTLGQHKEPKKASGGSCGSIGRKLPLEVSVEMPEGIDSSGAGTVVQFLLRNVGKVPISLPASPDPETVEPASGDYSIKRLSLYMTRCPSSSQTPCAIAKKQDMLKSNIELFGSEDSGTVITLNPGESLRVRGEVLIPKGNERRAETQYVGHAMVRDETVGIQNGKLVRTCIGPGTLSATSREYTLEALLGN